MERTNKGLEFKNFTDGSSLLWKNGTGVYLTSQFEPKTEEIRETKGEIVELRLA